MNTNPKKIVITAGPTVEPLDPVRFLSNFSTGLMGYSITKECIKRGYETCLISGPVSEVAPKGAEVINVTTAEEMLKAVKEKIEGASCLIMAAAVCDFAPVKPSGLKIKKSETLTIELKKNPDILSEVGINKGLIKIGFALETDNVLENAKDKVTRKNLDLIVVNTKTQEKDPFGEGEKGFFILTSTGDKKDIFGVTKEAMSEIILDEFEKMLK